MRTVIIGGGRGARAIIRLATSDYLKELALDIVCVIDPDPSAPGMVYAREKEIKTSGRMDDGIAFPGLEMIIELTGQDQVVNDIHKKIPIGVTFMDHTSARLFWDVANAREETISRLEEITALEERIESERLFLQNLVDNIPDLLVVFNRDRKAIKVNASFCRFVGISPMDAVGLTCEELLVNTGLAEKCRETNNLLDDAYHTGRPHTMIWKTQEPNMSYWEVSRVPILNRSGNIEAVLGTWHRITERVKLQHEIETAEQRFRGFIDSAHDWISIKDHQGRYVIVNPVCAKALNHSPEEFVGKTPEDLLTPELADDIRRRDARVLRTNKHQTYDEVFQVDGKEHYFQTLRFPLQDYKGTTIGVCTISRDVSSEKDLQTQLAQSAKLAAVGQLAAGVAHEINNPLTGVLAFAEDLVDELDKSSPHQESLKVIVRETLRCRDIVRNLLDFARQETPKLELIELNRIVDQSLTLVERLPQFRDIAIDRQLDPSVPRVNCDLYQLQQVVLNLMLNAQDAMKGKGNIKLSTTYDRLRDKCLISVEDDGPGIPENLIDKLFEPFFSTKGTSGLGLAVSWGIVERHHGVIEVDMADSGGAIFRIVLPAASDLE
ncbi:MAG: PAS domain-containing protein [candidate division Zixibacteria bacterium]|nr:PAS domain-containing protein [candidate division Zixibacteria bacterium]